MEKSNLESLVKENKNEEIKEILKTADYSTLVNDSGMTLIHLSIIHDNLDLLQYLIEAEFDLNVKTSFGSTPLEIAASFSRFDAMKILLQSDADIFEIGTNGKYTLKFIMNRLAKLPEDVVQCIVHNYLRNNLDRDTKIKMLIESDCTLKFILSIDDCVTTKTFLDHTDYSDKDELDSAVEYSMQREDEQTVKILLDHMDLNNISYNVFFKRLCKLFHWVSTDTLKIADLFLIRSMEWNIIDEKAVVYYYKSMFKMTSQEGAQVMLDTYIDVYVRERFGFEILFDFFENPKVDPRKLRMNNLFIVNGKNNEGDSALHVAVREKSEKNVVFLLDLGANPNLQNYNGMTPLYENLNSGQIFYGEILLKYGVDIQLDKQNITIFKQINHYKPNYRNFLECVVAQLAIDKARDIKIEKRFYDDMKVYGFTFTFNKCYEKVKELKNHDIVDSVSWFNVLTEKSEEIACHLHGKDYFKKFEDFCHKYLIHSYYRSMIEFKLQRVAKINVSRCNFAKIVYQMTGVQISIDHSVINKVFSFLCYYDMLKLV